MPRLYPQAREQRCWVHKTANILDRLPKRLQPKAKEMLQEHAAAGWIVRSPDRKSATEEMDRFSREFRAAYPKAVECLRKERETLLTFYDFPAEHWIHLRTTNPIESCFASAKARTRRTKGAGSRKAGLAMAYKRWRHKILGARSPLPISFPCFGQGLVSRMESKCKRPRKLVRQPRTKGCRKAGLGRKKNVVHLDSATVNPYFILIVWKRS